MKHLPYLTRSIGALATVSAISLATASFLPDEHPINRLMLSFADEDDIDEEVDEDIEEEIEDEIDEEIDDAIDDEVEDEVEDDVEDEVEDDVEDEVEDDVEDEVEDDVEDEVENDVEDEVDDDVDDELDAEPDFDFEDEFEEDDDELDDEFDDEEEEDLEDDEDPEEDEDPDEDEDEDEENEDDDEEDQDDDEETAEGVRLGLFDIELDERGDAFAANEFLVLGSADEIAALVDSGLVPEDITDFDSLDLQLARVSSLGSQTRDEVEALIADIAPNAEIDINHLYFEQADPYPADTGRGAVDASLSNSAEFTIGMIDTALNATHETLLNARLTEQDFVRVNLKRPNQHGTAVASLLVGQSETYVGLLPNADLYAASVFFETPTGARSATTDSLVAGLAWLVEADVDVINMSLSGPPNAILERAVASVLEQGKVLVAVVGNDGPMASPRYPAAYDGVIGATAISEANTAFRLAGRGAHVDFSAPGVAIKHAAQGNTYSVSSGTSFAAPYVTASYALALQTHANDAAYEILAVTAEDLGPIGFDPIYGHGLIRPPIIYQTATADSDPGDAD